MRNFFILATMSIIVTVACAQEPTTHIRMNQIGFLPFSQKQAAIVNTSAEQFQIIDEEKHILFTGTLSEASVWSASGESVKIADFTVVTKPGTYILVVPDYGASFPFVIAENVFDDVNKAIVKAFYLNRASIELLPKYAGIYARPAGHLDTEVIILPSAAGPKRKAGDVISAPKGWYDAGDYNKYIVNSNITVGTMLLAYENYSSYFDTLTWNIPESGNGKPDLLDEIRWNLEWMLTMQDPDDGGVYNKTTEARFSPVLMPHEVTVPRYVVAKGTAATLGFAAVMAMSYRIYKPFDADFAQTCLKAAVAAWEWGQKNPNVPYVNPPKQGKFPAVSTGGYGNTVFDDERIWAASELLIATQQAKKYAPFIDVTGTFTVPAWPNVETFALYSLYNHRKAVAHAVDTQRVKQNLLKKARELQVYQAYNNPYRVPAIEFPWGSNGVMANQAILLLYAYNITNSMSYFNAALACYDYILGRNATEYSFVTGYGGKSSSNIHHRASQADGIPGAIPGFVAGGPNGGQKRDCYGNYSRFPAKAYVDQYCSYTTNEVAINWQAPLTYAAHAIVAEYRNWIRNKGTSFAVSLDPVIVCSHNQDSFVLTVLSNTSWELVFEDDWYTTNQLQGEGNERVTFSIPSKNNSERSGTVSLIVDSVVVQAIHIQQYGLVTNFRVEAESYIDAYGVQKEITTDEGGGLNVGWISNDDYITYELHIPKTGMYNLSFRIACYDNNGSFYMADAESVYAIIETYPTGGWQSWVDISDSAFFEEGVHVFTLHVIEGGFNINYFDFTYLGETQTKANMTIQEMYKKLRKE